MYSTRHNVELKKRKKDKSCTTGLNCFFMADKSKKRSFGLCMYQKTVFVASQKLLTLMNVLENREYTRDTSESSR